MLKRLHKIIGRINDTGEVPEEWGCAYMILIAKDKRLDNPELFRNIAITNTSGTIYFSYLANCLESFMGSVQKGFLKGVAGCVEHTFSLQEILRDAYDHNRQIVVTWIDLANAYGSVMHNLIQFALEWYHVPLKARRIIFSYYDRLMAKVITINWQTNFFHYDIGLFQGCTMSTILFDTKFIA